MAEVEPAFAATLSTPPRSRRQIHGTVARRLFANVATYIVVIGLAFGLGAAFVAITGSSPSAVVRALVDGSVGSPQSLSQTLSYALPIMVVAAGAAIAGRAGFLNVGQEGQVTIGALGATIVALNVRGPTLILILLSLLGAASAGAVWAAPMAYMRIRRNVSEVISSLLLTFVAVSVVSFAVNRSYLLQGVRAQPQSDRIPVGARFGTVELGSFRVSVAIIIVASLIAGLAVTFRSTRWAARARVCGANPSFAEAMGIDTARVGWSALVASGAMAGLGGGIILTTTSFQLQTGIANDFGWNGLLVALVARNRLPGVVVLALAFGGLRAGSGFVETTGTPRYIVQVLQALLVIASALPPLYLEQRRLRAAT